MATSPDQTLWERERAFLKEERAKYPELFVVDPEKAGDLLAKIGVTAIPKSLPPGYIRYSPLDFIVEEISADGLVIEVGTEPARRQGEEFKGTVWADLVKVGISTLDAAKRITAVLGLDEKNVRYAGIKDAVAVTAQRISVRGSRADEVAQIDVPNVVLKNIFEGKGALNVGDLAGNRFVLFVRTPEVDSGSFEARLEEVKRGGVVNYYGEQRFGSPRFLSHLYGQLMLRGDAEGAVRASLTAPSPTEMPYSAQIRARAAERYGAWSAMRQEFERLPYTFRHELDELSALERAGGGVEGFHAALAAVPKQATLWVYAYASYLANSLLSHWATSDASMPERIPLLFSPVPEARRLYAPWLKVDGTERFMEMARTYRFLSVGRESEIMPVIRPKFHAHQVTPEGVAISFSLPKAAYATTVLRHLFTLGGGFPLPEWLKKTAYDTKELLGLGSLVSVRQRFAKEIEAATKGAEDTGSDPN